MNVLIIKAAIGAAIGAAAAAVTLAAFDLGWSKGLEQAYAEGEREMLEMEDRLKRLYKIGEFSSPFVGTEAGLAVPPEVADGLTHSRLVAQRAQLISDGVDPDMLEKLNEHIQSQGYALHEDSAVPSGRTIFDRYKNEDVQDEDSTVTPNMSDPEPYVIAEEEFANGEEDYTKISLSYYPADGVVADDMDRVVEDIESTIGGNNLMGYDSDTTVIYVRNNRLQADFEIAVEEGSYRETVMGIDDGPVMERRGRKSRSPQDD